MDRIDNILEKSLATYFNTLVSTGYKCYNDVNKLLFLSMIEEITSGPLSHYVSDSDYNSINNALYCIYGTTCIIPYPKAKDSPVGVNGDLEYLRITEDDIIRFTQQDEPRIYSI